MNTGVPASEKTLRDELAIGIASGLASYVGVQFSASQAWDVVERMLAEKARREAVVKQSSTTQAREVDDDHWAKFQDGIRIVFQPTNGWCAEIRDGSMGYGNTISEAVANLRARWEERSAAPVVQQPSTTDHSPDATKMIAIESANRELVEALGWVSKTIATTDDHKSKVAMTVILREVDTIIAKHKGAA